MTLSDLAAIGSFISGLAVVVTLIFLLLQMRQNTRAIKAAASQAHAANYQSLVASVIDNVEVARLWRVGLGGIENLNDDEKVRFVSLSSGFFRFFEAARLQWRHGQLDTEHWHSIETQIRDTIPNPGVQSYLRMRGHWHSPEFRAWIDSLPKESLERGIYDTPSENGNAFATSGEGSP
jgi:hypothetical protein